LRKALRPVVRAARERLLRVVEAAVLLAADKAKAVVVAEVVPR
jgi:hypothetical protein